MLARENVLISIKLFLGIAVGHQGDVEDVLQHGPGGEEHLGEEGTAPGTQALVVELQLDRLAILIVVGASEVGLQALLQNPTLYG